MVQEIETQTCDKGLGKVTKWYTLKEKPPPFLVDIVLWDGKRVFAGWNECNPEDGEETSIVTAGGNSWPYIKKWAYLPKAPKEKKMAKKKNSKVEKVMHEFGEGKLHSGSKKGPVVSSQKQAVAIALSEARKAGAKIPKPKKK